MFIGVMLKLIVVSLFMLSVIMMNNMLLMGVERKNFDFALLKVMGANRLFIVINLLSSSLKYVLFANFIAYPLAYLVLGAVTDVFQSFFGYKH
jgi:ABC-type lipoprotein release transport system permease subunit